MIAIIYMLCIYICIHYSNSCYMGGCRKLWPMSCKQAFHLPLPHMDTASAGTTVVFQVSSDTNLGMAREPRSYLRGWIKT